MHPELGIAWLPGASKTIHRFRRLAPKHCSVTGFTDEFALLAALGRGEIAVTVVEAGGANHASIVRALRRIHDAFPEQPLIAWCDMQHITTSELLEVLSAGVQDIIRNEFDELRLVIDSTLTTASQRTALARITRALHGVIPKTLRPICEYALEHAHEHLDRETVAAGFGLSLRTLHGRLIVNGLPPTRTFLTWCRLLVASALLDQPGHTLDSVAGRLNYHDGGTLGNVFRRYTGHGVNRFRETSVLDATVAAFRASIAAGSRRNPTAHSLPGPSSAD